MTDLWSDRDMGRILLHFHKEKKPTASLCHGPIALLSTRVADKDSPWAYEGYEMTCYSNTEEKTNEMLFGSKLQGRLERYTVVVCERVLWLPAAVLCCAVLRCAVLHCDVLRHTTRFP